MRLHGRSRRWLRWIAVLAAVLVLTVVAAGTWYLQPQSNLPSASTALAATSDVAVSQDRGWLEFLPTGSLPTTGLILYPGGKVEPAAYARSAQAIAGAGYVVVVVPMPLNLAVLGADRASEVTGAYPDIEHWANRRPLPGRRHGGPVRSRASR